MAQVSRAGPPRSARAAIDGAIAIPADVTDEEQVQSLIQQTADECGGLHIMVPNAGVGTPQPLIETSLDDWRRVTSVNLDGVFLSIRYAAPAIIASGGGSIITLSSITATAGSPLMASYAASKAAVRNLTETAAAEPRPAGVRVNALLPGFIDTAPSPTAHRNSKPYLASRKADSARSSTRNKAVTARRRKSQQPRHSSLPTTPPGAPGAA